MKKILIYTMGFIITITVAIYLFLVFSLPNEMIEVEKIKFFQNNPSFSESCRKYVDGNPKWIGRYEKCKLEIYKQSVNPKVYYSVKVQGVFIKMISIPLIIPYLGCGLFSDGCS